MGKKNKKWETRAYPPPPPPHTHTQFLRPSIHASVLVVVWSTLYNFDYAFHNKHWPHIVGYLLGTHIAIVREIGQYLSVLIKVRLHITQANSRNELVSNGHVKHSFIHSFKSTFPHLGNSIDPKGITLYYFARPPKHTDSFECVDHHRACLIVLSR